MSWYAEHRKAFPNAVDHWETPKHYHCVDCGQRGRHGTRTPMVFTRIHWHCGYGVSFCPRHGGNARAMEVMKEHVKSCVLRLDDVWCVNDEWP